MVTSPPARRLSITVGGTSHEIDVFTSVGPGPAVFVLLHGIGMSHRYLLRLQEQLALTGTVHSIDLPGFGATPHPEHVLSVEEHARVVGGALDVLGVTSATIVGHSMGTQFAIEVARQRPGLTERLVLMAPVVDPGRRTVLQQALALSLDSLREPPSANLVVFTDYLRCGVPWYLKTLPAMMDYPTEQRVSDVGCPVLVLRGDRDPVSRLDFCRLLARSAPNGRLLQLPGSAHVLQQSAPRSVAAAILRFSADAEPGAGRPTRRHPRVQLGLAPLLRRWWWWTLDYTYAGLWQARSVLPGAQPDTFLNGTRRPVVIIPGIYETWRFMQPLVARLHDAGHPVHVMTALRHNRRSVVDAAALVSAHLREHGLDDVVIVAHSKGGLIGKYLMLDPQVADRITAMVTVCTPYSGSRYARLMLMPSLRAFSPREPTTLRLAADVEVNARIRSVFGLFDPHIPEGSELPDAENVRLPVGGHFRILGDERTIALVLDAAANGVGPTRVESPGESATRSSLPS